MLNTGDRIGDWIVQTRIGEGAMGEVWLAQDAVTQRLHAAVKVLKTSGMDMSRERFIREIESLAKLRHPSIVRVLGWGRDEERDLLWLAMERLQGSTLAKRIRNPRLMQPLEVLDVFARLTAGLRHAHSEGIAHRDLKPANIMLCDDGMARILDFGIAMPDGATRFTAAGSVTGTGAYLPPEAFEQDSYDFKLGDVYAMGVCMYEALEGKNAFGIGGPDDSPHQRVMRLLERKKKPISISDTVPEPIREVVLRATDPDPRKRFADAAELALGIEEARGGRIPSSPTRTSKKPPKRSGSSGRWLGTLVFAAMAIGGAVTFAGGLLYLVGKAPQMGTDDAQNPAETPSDAAPSPTSKRPPSSRKPPSPTGLVQPPPPEAGDPGTAQPEPAEPDPVEPRANDVIAPPRDLDVDPSTLIAITFQSEPSGAKVSIDGVPIGATPIGGYGLTPGKHLLTMEYAGGAVSREIKVNNRREIRYILRNGEIKGFK